MKKKVVATSKRQYARIAADLDGKYNGLSQAESELALERAFLLDKAAIIAGYQSPLLMLHKKAVKAADAFKKKRAAAREKAKSKKGAKVGNK